MDKIYIKVDKKTGMVYLENTVIGRDKENLQQELIFSFENGFILGSPRLEYKIGNNRCHIPMERIDETYVVPIKNILTVEGKIEMQLVIVESEQDEEIPVFKSNVFYVYCNKSINAQTEAPDDYEYWLDVIQTKLAEMDNLDISAERVSDGVNITITDKEGMATTTKVNDGAKGDTGNPGPTGEDGFSPIANVTKVGQTATITITDKTGTTTASISDGLGQGTITSVKMNGDVIASSGEADLGTIITQHQDISGKEDTTNKVTSISSSSTDTQYPSAKCVYDIVGDISTILESLVTVSGGE